MAENSQERSRWKPGWISAICDGFGVSMSRLADEVQCTPDMLRKIDKGERRPGWRLEKRIEEWVKAHQRGGPSPAAAMLDRARLEQVPEGGAPLDAARLHALLDRVVDSGNSRAIAAVVAMLELVAPSD